VANGPHSYHPTTMSDKGFTIIAAVAHGDNAIGSKGKLPWHIPEDLKHFATLTKGQHHDGATKFNAVIMGRKTFDSLPPKFRPLPGRLNIVLSRQCAPSDFPDAVHCFNSLDKSLEFLNNLSAVQKIFVIGGAEIYQEAIQHPQCDTLYITDVFLPTTLIPDADAYFPHISPDVWKPIANSMCPLAAGKNAKPEGVSYSVCVYTRI
jgi:dihydrofolate reductase